MINKTTYGGKRKPTISEYVAYLKAVRDVLEDEKKSYQEFFQLLKDYRTQRLDLERVIEMVKILFAGHPDLLLGFNTFLPEGYEITITSTAPDCISDEEALTDPDCRYEEALTFVERVKARFRDEYEEALTFVKRVKARFRDEYHVFLSFFEILKEILKGENKSSIYLKVAALFRDHPDLIDEFTLFLPSKPSSYAVDLSNCEACTPSYYVLPEDYPIPATTRRTLRDSQVLNDSVCITPSAASCSRGIRKTRFEQSLFQCENDMFELDMLLGTVNSTIMKVEQLLEKIEDDRISASSCVEGHLTDQNLRCIERVYGKQGLHVVDMLRENAEVALPVVLFRLKQKQEEWEQCRSDFSQVWAQVYAKNLNNDANHDG